MGVEIPLLLSPVIPPGNMRGARTGACTLGGVVSLTTPEHGDLTAADRDTVTELSALPGGWSAEQDHPDLAVYAVERPPRVRTLVDIFQETCQHHPETVAIQGEDDEITYQELEELVDIQAQRLWDRGIGRGDRVGIRVPSGTTDLYVAILATLAAGAAYVPVDADDRTLERRRSGRRPRWRPSSGPDFRWVRGPPSPRAIRDHRAPRTMRGSSSPPARPARPREWRSLTAAQRPWSTLKLSCTCATAPWARRTG